MVLWLEYIRDLFPLNQWTTLEALKAKWEIISKTDNFYQDIKNRLTKPKLAYGLLKSPVKSKYSGTLRI